MLPTTQYESPKRHLLEMCPYSYDLHAALCLSSLCYDLFTITSMMDIAGANMVILASIRKRATLLDRAHAHQTHSCQSVPSLSQANLEEAVFLVVVGANEGRGNSGPVHHDESWAMGSVDQDSHNQVEGASSAGIQEYTYHSHHVVNAMAC